MPKLNFSANLLNTIRNNILKLPVIPAGGLSIIQDVVQDGHQNVKTAIFRLVFNITLRFKCPFKCLLFVYIIYHKDYNETDSESLIVKPIIYLQFKVY